ncbi:MAG: DNA mismatch repair endonuclease MutL, partial [Lachnospiraceae bacterium]|nr:DNA mismatch repair endonuclease MutL [Lachnospiraceae bacterium]
MAINILDENTINKIAAGEVIENPASVVKELIENAIDANAKNIVIEIKDGGCQLIKITDDGDGFLKDDIELAFINHATSKIKDINDLFDINSFGFRGEALASIAAIANVNLITKSRNSKDLQGYSFSIRFGKDSGLVDAASNYGSTIEINDLFGNVPVRKKFLKSPAKEAAYINDVVTKCAISRPDIAFELYIDDKLKFASNGNSNLEEIIYSLYGKDIYSNLVKVSDNVKGIQVNGLIAKPIVARNSKNDIIYFVNNRYIKSSIIQKAIENAYEGYLMQHKYPLAILNISI